MNRELPHTEIGDLLVIHDTGAHGFSMGYQPMPNYARQKSSIPKKEKPAKSAVQSALRDYFATLYGFDFESDQKKLKMKVKQD